MKIDTRNPFVKKVAALVACVAITLLCAACAAFQKVVPFLPTPSQSECVLVDIEAGKPALVILNECGLEQDALAYVESLLAGQKRKVAHRAARAAEADAGADGGK